MECLWRSHDQKPWGLRPLGFWPLDLSRLPIHHDTPLAFPNNVPSCRPPPPHPPPSLNIPAQTLHCFQETGFSYTGKWHRKNKYVYHNLKHSYLVKIYNSAGHYVKPPFRGLFSEFRWEVLHFCVFVSGVEEKENLNIYIFCWTQEGPAM